ncbi:rod shape-determining protein [Desertibacillus haloalkaliphilus]|uniref:rod shape-determining protein n=1 Tax=Desertibacillus haloalkaliphilus TaxID=1328930 RepID=UPI001C257398|nr:rod shape-determining protein [Desertibacillus haloalkaliphilus]MBU8906061.1 rod shape-determining protein [Desertibacillus haloalkaliphilus]
MFGRYNIGIDLGTANTLVYVKGNGIVVREPSIVAKNMHTGTVEAIGLKAKQLTDRTSSHIVSVRPMQSGVIADYDTAATMIRYFMKKAFENKGKLLNVMNWRKSNVMICVPVGTTPVEKRAIHEAAKQAGAHNVYTIEEPFAAAMGASLPVWEPNGSMVIDIGGGSTEVGVLSYGGIVTSSSLRIAGDDMDEAIIQHVKKKYNIWIGKQTAETLKIEIGSAMKPDKDEYKEIRGLDLVTGLPKIVSVSSTDIYEALIVITNAIVEIVKNTLEKIPPELASDVIDQGVVLAGGGALLRRLNTLISDEILIPVHVSESPLDCVAVGTGSAFEHLDLIQSTIDSKNKELSH